MYLQIFLLASTYKYCPKNKLNKIKKNKEKIVLLDLHYVRKQIHVIIKEIRLTKY